MSDRDSWIENYPFPPDKKKACILSQERSLRFIYPPDRPYESDLNTLLVSTDRMTVGIDKLSPGAHWDPPDTHPGDEVYYILEGRLTILNPESGSCCEVKKGEAVFLPLGSPHKGYNFTNEACTFLYVIAPKIWDEGGPSGYAGEIRIYRPKEGDPR